MSDDDNRRVVCIKIWVLPLVRYFQKQHQIHCLCRGLYMCENAMNEETSQIKK